MEVTYDTKTVPVVKWNVAIPRENSTVESKCFLMNGVRWKLRLGSKIVGDLFSSNLLTEKWIMRLIKDSHGSSPQFHLTLYIRHGVKDVFLAETKISSASTEIWSSSCSSFRTNYPQIPVAGNALLFVLDFHGVDEDNNQRNPPKVHKSVQATDFPVRSDVNTCLENLSLDMSKLMDENPDAADVQLKCGDLTIGAHKLILGARSEVFRTMMQSDMLEGREGVVEIVDMEPRVLQIFVRYIYTGTLPDLTEDTVLSLYEAADKYQVDGLGKRSSRLLSKILSRENALGILAIADAHDDKDLKSRVLSYVVNKDIPRNDENWLKFCNDYPKLVVEVLNCQLFRGSR